MNARRLLRVAAFNAVLVVGFWLVLILVTALAGDVYNWARLHVPRTDERAALPSYEDPEAARLLFSDFKRTIEDYVPYLAWRRQAMRTDHVNIGADGYRIHRAGKAGNAADARAIGFFGGSTMWGTGVADDDTIPAIFDQLTTGYDVTNYGEGGHNARQMFALLVNLIDTREMPDVVVFYGGFNHVWTHCNYAVTRRLNGHMVERKLRRALTERPRGGYLWADVLAPPIDFVRRVIGEKRFVRDDFACHDDPVRAEQVAEALVRIWEMAGLLVRAWGGEFHAFLQPVAYLGSPRLDHLELGRVVGAAQFRAVYPLIQTKAAARGDGWYADLTGAFDGDAYLYIDDAHVTRPGNEIIARRMLEVVGN